MITRIKTIVAVAASGVLAASVAVAVTLASPASAAIRHHPCQPGYRRELAAIYTVRKELDAHGWYETLRAGGVPAVGLAYKIRLSKLQRLLRQELWLDLVHAKRQCEGGL